MRKFPKLLAAVLALAIVICPAMCLTSMADEPSGTYAFTQAITSGTEYDTATLTVSAENGFIVALAKVSLHGYTLVAETDDVDPVTALSNENEVLAADYSVSDSAVTVLVKHKDLDDMSLISSATVSFKVVKADAEDHNHYLTLTHIQAADKGVEAEDGTIGNENLLTFPYANNNENGLIDQVTAAANNASVMAGVNCEHNRGESTTVTAPTCTDPGSESFTCADCGATWTATVDALGHDWACTSISDTQHANVCQNEGCNAVQDGTTADHTFEDGYCTECGHEQEEASGPVQVETTYKHNMTLANSTRLNIYISKNNQWNSCSTIEAVVTREDYSTGVNVPKETTITFTLYSASLYRAEYGDFYSYQYGDVFTAHIVGKDAEGNIIYESANDDVYCVKAYCATQLANASAVEATKVVCADLLTFGAKAQDFFNSYRTDNYANQDDSRYTVASYVAKYATATTPELTKKIVDTDSTDLVKVYSSLTFGSSIDFNMICEKSKVTGYDLSNLKFVMTYKNYKNVDKRIEVSGSDFNGNKVMIYYYAVCNEIYVADFSSDLTIALYNGDELVSNQRCASVEAYAKFMIEKDGATQTTIDFYNAMMNYSKSAANIQFIVICLEVIILNANLEIVKLNLSDVVCASVDECDPDCYGETEII